MAYPGTEPQPALPVEVRDRLGAYTAALDAACPGRLAGLYVVGSVALGDFRPRFSNIDVVAVSDFSWSEAELGHARRAHRQLDRNRAAGTVYATWTQLAADPRPLNQDLANPFTWRILRDDAMVERGPDYPEIWFDDEALARWARLRLRERWAPWVRSAKRRPQSMLGRSTVSERVLGAAQLYQAMAGRVQGKAAAGRATIGAVGSNSDRVLRDSAGFREGSRTSMYWGILERRRHAIEFVDEIVRRAAGG
jgi:hypothetical protein